MQLSALPRGARARIAAIDADDRLAHKLLAMGLQEGMELQLLHQGLIRRDPMAIAINDRIVALRRKDASHIEVEPIA